MSTTTDTVIPTLNDKVRELCQFILEDPSFASAQGGIDAFQEDKGAQGLYREWQQKASELHQQHNQGMQPAPEDIAEMERLKQIVMENSVAADFVEAEDSINEIFGSVMKIVQKTLQDGEIPSDEDLECCGQGG